MNNGSSAPRRAILLGLGLLALLLAPAMSSSQPPLRTEPLAVVTQRGVSHFTVEVADTDKTREQGLMFRKFMAPGRGMLFDFKRPQEVAFWMKNTLIPLDMLFIAQDGRIVYIAHEATPLSEVPIPSGGVVLGVLELAGGRAAQIGVVPGDEVRNRIFRR